jgi:glutaredoxin-related protein
MIEFFKLEHSLRDFYGKVTQEGASTVLEAGVAEVRENLQEFDTSWSTFERLYVLELMGI